MDGGVDDLPLARSDHLVFSIINPTGWLFQSIGLQERSLKIGLVLSPLVICSYFVGLPYGPSGVALASSTIMVCG